MGSLLARTEKNLEKRGDEIRPFVEVEGRYGTDQGDKTGVWYGSDDFRVEVHQ